MPVLAVVVAVVVLAVVVLAPGPRSPQANRRRPETQGQAVDPALFSPGSCISFPPTAGDRHEIVFLDAGHGGIDPGALGTTTTGRTIYEADETLPVELATMKLLRARGLRVVVSRTRSSSVVRLTPADVADGVLTEKGPTTTWPPGTSVPTLPGHRSWWGFISILVPAPRTRAA